MIRGTRQQRGYDDAWLRVRAAFLRRHPLCEPCKSRGKIVLACQAHHKQPFKGKDDPKRLSVNNLMAVCRACHAKLSAEASNRGRGSSRR